MPETLRAPALGSSAGEMGANVQGLESSQDPQIPLDSSDRLNKAKREQRRAAFLDRVLWIVRAGQEETSAGETDASYAAIVASLNNDS